MQHLKKKERGPHGQSMMEGKKCASDFLKFIAFHQEKEGG